MRVLLVEPDALTRDTLEGVLSSRGHEVVVRADAAIAWQDLQAETFPIVVLADRLPDESGLTLCRRLRGLTDGDCSVILVTTQGEADDFAAILDAGADDTVVKPVEPLRLHSRLGVAERRAADMDRRRRAHRTLLQAKLIVENSPTILFTRIAAGGGGHTFDFVSENVAQLGYAPDELLSGKVTYAGLVHPDDRERVLREGEDQLRRGAQQLQLVYRLITRHGEVRWIDERTTVERNAAGRAAFFHGVLVDITERRQAEEALRQSEERYRELFENANDMVYTHDLTGAFTSANRAAEQVSGYTRSEILRMNVSQIVAPEYLERASDMIARKVSEEVRTFYEVEIIARDGRRVPLEVSTRLIYRGGRPVEVQGVARDIAERRRAEEARRQSEDRFPQSEKAPIGVAFVGLNRRFLKANGVLCAMLGYTEEDLSERTFLDITHRDDLDINRRQLDQLFKGELPRLQLERRFITSGGEVVWVNATGSLIRGADGVPRYGLVMIENITERKLLEQRLRHQAFYDPLTGLANRTLFMDRLEHALARAERDLHAVAVMYLDLDGFKSVNDTFGHDQGDQLLIAVGSRLARCLRPMDTIARFGGDEFTVLLEGMVRGHDATGVARRVVETLQQPFELDAGIATVTTSIGVALRTPSSAQPGELLRQADVALYRAKSEGKNRYVVFDPAVHSPAGPRLRPSPRN